MPKRSRIKDFFWRHSAGIAFLVMIAFVALIGFVGYTYVVITRKFDSSRRWDLPSRIYSDATPIVPGMTRPARAAADCATASSGESPRERQ